MTTRMHLYPRITVVCLECDWLPDLVDRLAIDPLVGARLHARAHAGHVVEIHVQYCVESLEEGEDDDE